MMALGLAVTLLIFGKRGLVLTACALIAGLAVLPSIGPYIIAAVRGIDGMVEIALPIAIATGATAWVVFELGDSGTRTLTPWIALLLPALWVVAGGPFADIYDGALAVVGEADAVANEMGW